MTDPQSRLTEALAGRYAIERELGAGGMATVYLAHDLRHDRRVAIKVLRPELAAVIGADRFLAEIKTTANLQHPHILPLFDSGVADSFLFYVMPYVEGISLRDRMSREKQLPIPEAVRIASEIAAALDYAHRRGVIHRDIKPENILLHDGSALVADFGIALAASKAGTRMTETGMSLGTPQYMSPEQAMGERELDARSDVYALGCVTYEMLTGEPPFSGPTAQAIVAKVMTAEPANISGLRRTIPAPVAVAVHTALQKLPADRFASAAEFAAALAAPVTVAMTSAPRTRQGVDWRVALLGGLALGAATMFLLNGRRGAAPAGGSGARQQLTFHGQARRPAISPDGAWVAYAKVVCQNDHPNQCKSSVQVQEVGSTQSVAILVDAMSIQLLRWNHDGTQVVVGGMLDSVRRGVFVVPRSGGVARQVGFPGAFDTHPSADTLVNSRRQQDGRERLYFVSLATGAVVDSAPNLTGPTRDIHWSPDGKYFAALTGDRGVAIYARDGRRTDTLGVKGRYVARWSVRGNEVLVFKVGAVKEDELISIPVDNAGRITGAPRIVLPRVPTLYNGEFDLARRSGRMAFATGDAINDFWTFDFSTPEGAGRQRTRGTTWYGGPAISPDGTMLYYGRGDALGDNVYALSLKDDSEEPLTAQTLPFGNEVHIAHDGHRIAFGHSTDSGVRMDVMELPSRKLSSQMGGSSTTTFWPRGARGYLDVRADGRALLVLDSLGAKWQTIMGPDTMFIDAAAPSPDGTRAVVFAATKGGEVVLGTTPLDAWRFTPIPVSPALSGLSGSLLWDEDGSIYMTMWRPVDDRPAVWRIPIGGGVPVRVVKLHARCEATGVSVSTKARIAVCLSSDYRSDIWVMDGVGNP